MAALQAEPAVPATLGGQPAILSVSRLDPVKRIDDIIAALALLPSAELHIVGRGPDERRLRDHAVAAGVANRVHFHGFKSDTEVAALARGADVFVIASAAEGMPTTILEMLARGVPVVASDIPGNRSLMQPLGDPHLYELGDIRALAAAIAAAAGEPVTPETMARLQSMFDWSAITATLLRLYTA